MSPTAELLEPQTLPQVRERKSVRERSPIKESPVMANISYIRRLAEEKKTGAARRNAGCKEIIKHKKEAMEAVNERLKKLMEDGKIDPEFMHEASDIISEYLDYKSDPDNKGNPTRRRPGIINLPPNRYAVMKNDHYEAIMNAWKAIEDKAVVDKAMRKIIGKDSGFSRINDADTIRKEAGPMLVKYLHKIIENPKIDREQAKHEFGELVNEQKWSPEAKDAVTKAASAGVRLISSNISQNNSLSR